MNIFQIPADLPNEEVFEVLASKDATRIERIISTGQRTPPGQWYDQAEDEWVVLLQGEARLAYRDGSVRRLVAGDAVLIPAHQAHRVDYTSAAPPCIWLAVHGCLC